MVQGRIDKERVFRVIMTDPNRTHLELSKALIAGVLDFPAILNAPEIARIQAGDLHPAFSSVWRQIHALHIANNLSVTTLSASCGEGFTIPYLNELRAEFANTSFEDLQGIGEALRNHAENRDLDGLARELMVLAHSGGKAEDIARDFIKRMTPIALSKGHTFTPLKEALSEVYNEIEERSKNPSDVWGIPYKYAPKLSSVTGGKQKGEMILFAGEPKVGKSWWAIQDAMGTAIDGVPTAMWSGEMKNKQITRRMLQLMGLDGRRSRTGYMNQEDWDTLNHGVEVLENVPFYQDDKSLHIDDLRPALTALKNEFGIEHVVLDYAYLIGAKGKDENERTGMVSREVKTVINDLDLSCMLIASVSKLGMDTTENAVKSMVRGSGQQIHDADIIYLLTKFAPVKDDPEDMKIKPNEYEYYATLHVSAGRELDAHIPGGRLHYKRQNSPKFEER